MKLVPKTILAGLAILFICSPFSYSQSQNLIQGKVESVDGSPLSSVTVGIKAINKGTFTDENGLFTLNQIPAGRHTLYISLVGYQKVEREITVSPDSALTLNITLHPSMHLLDQVVVTGTMKETSIKESPVKVSWISGEVLKKSSSDNLMEAVNYINGLYNQVDCAVCGTNSIRINGMEGPYTSVLVDGMPLMGALSSVYGLNGINPNIIQNLEIIKGPNSTLYGSQAMGGVINIITTNPSTSPLFTAEVNSSTHSESNLNLAFTPVLGKARTLVSSTLYHAPRFIDQNGDGFSDLTQDTRFTLFNKWSLKRPEFREFSIAAKYYHEQRLGGTEAYSHDLRGSSEVYGESIYTNRFEVFGKYDLPIDAADIRLDASYAYHDQDSWYGDYHYEASQQTLYSNLIWDEALTQNNDLLMGIALKYDYLDQVFNGTRVDGGSESKRFVPGLFIQYDHILNESLRGLAGLRVDHYGKHGFFFSPRMNWKITPGHHTTLRLNTGTGFRIVNLFTEEHEALTGSRQVIVGESLDPEESFNVAFNLNQIIDIGPSVLNTDLDVFYTRFTNQIIPDYSQPNQIIYTNLDGHSVSRGISVSMAHNFIIPLTYMIGFTFQDVYRVEENTKEELPFAPDYSAVFSLSYTFSKPGISLDYTGRLNGPMRLPEYPGRSVQSDIYSEHNLKISRQFENGLKVYLSGSNLLNYTQPQPLIAPDRPFSDEFATDYVFGPMQGRRFTAGISFRLD